MPPAVAAGVGTGLPVIGGIINAVAGGDAAPIGIYRPGGEAVAGSLSDVLQGQLGNLPELNIDELLAAVQGARGAALPEVPKAGYAPEVQKQITDSLMADLAPQEERARLQVKDMLGSMGPSTIGLQTAAGTEGDILRNRGRLMSDLAQYFQTTGFNQALQAGEAQRTNTMFPVMLEQGLLGNLSNVRNTAINQALDFSSPFGTYTQPSIAAGIGQAVSGLGNTAAEFGRGGAFEGAFGGRNQPTGGGFIRMADDPYYNK